MGYFFNSKRCKFFKQSAALIVVGALLISFILPPYAQAKQYPAKPESHQMRDRVLSNRSKVERDVVLAPYLSAVSSEQSMVSKIFIIPSFQSIVGEEFNQFKKKFITLFKDLVSVAASVTYRIKDFLWGIGDKGDVILKQVIPHTLQSVFAGITPRFRYSNSLRENPPELPLYRGSSIPAIYDALQDVEKKIAARELTQAAQILIDLGNDLVNLLYLGGDYEKIMDQWHERYNNAIDLAAQDIPAVLSRAYWLMNKLIKDEILDEVQLLMYESSQALLNFLTTEETARRLRNWFKNERTIITKHQPTKKSSLSRVSSEIDREALLDIIPSKAAQLSSIKAKRKELGIQLDHFLSDAKVIYLDIGHEQAGDEIHIFLSLAPALRKKYPQAKIKYISKRKWLWDNDSDIAYVSDPPKTIENGDVLWGRSWNGEKTRLLKVTNGLPDEIYFDYSDLLADIEEDILNKMNVYIDKRLSENIFGVKTEQHENVRYFIDPESDSFKEGVEFVKTHAPDPSKPKILFNGFGGMSSNKGFTNELQQAKFIATLIQETDAYVFIVLNHWTKNNKKISNIKRHLKKILGPKVNQAILLPPTFENETLTKYVAYLADMGVTVEGGMTHLLYALDKPLISMHYLDISNPNVFFPLDHDPKTQLPINIHYSFDNLPLERMKDIQKGIMDAVKKILNIVKNKNARTNSVENIALRNSRGEDVRTVIERFRKLDPSWGSHPVDIWDANEKKFVKRNYWDHHLEMLDRTNWTFMTEFEEFEKQEAERLSRLNAQDFEIEVNQYLHDYKGDGEFIFNGLSLSEALDRLSDKIVNMGEFAKPQNIAFFYEALRFRRIKQPENLSKIGEYKELVLNSLQHHIYVREIFYRWGLPDSDELNPEIQKVVEADPDAQTQGTAAAKKPRILVVDDSEGIRRIISKSLIKKGFEVVEANDGQDALNKLETMEPFDLIITDMDMPRIGGEELIETVSKRENPPKMILQSGDHYKGAKVAQKFGVPFYGKDDSLDPLIEMVTDLIGKNPTTQGGNWMWLYKLLKHTVLPNLTQEEYNRSFALLEDVISFAVGAGVVFLLPVDFSEHHLLTVLLSYLAGKVIYLIGHETWFVQGLYFLFPFLDKDEDKSAGSRAPPQHLEAAKEISWWNLALSLPLFFFVQDTLILAIILNLISILTHAQKNTKFIIWIAKYIKTLQHQLFSPPHQYAFPGIPNKFGQSNEPIFEEHTYKSEGQGNDTPDIQTNSTNAGISEPSHASREGDNVTNSINLKERLFLIAMKLRNEMGHLILPVLETPQEIIDILEISPSSRILTIGGATTPLLFLEKSGSVHVVDIQEDQILFLKGMIKRLSDTDGVELFKILEKQIDRSKLSPEEKALAKLELALSYKFLFEPNRIKRLVSKQDAISYSVEDLSYYKSYARYDIAYYSTLPLLLAQDDNYPNRLPYLMELISDQIQRGTTVVFTTFNLDEYSAANATIIRSLPANTKIVKIVSKQNPFITYNIVRMVKEGDGEINSSKNDTLGSGKEKISSTNHSGPAMDGNWVWFKDMFFSHLQQKKYSLKWSWLEDVIAYVGLSLIVTPLLYLATGNLESASLIAYFMGISLSIHGHKKWMAQLIGSRAPPQYLKTAEFLGWINFITGLISIHFPAFLPLAIANVFLTHQLVNRFGNKIISISQNQEEDIRNTEQLIKKYIEPSLIFKLAKSITKGALALNRAFDKNSVIVVDLNKFVKVKGDDIHVPPIFQEILKGIVSAVQEERDGKAGLAIVFDSPRREEVMETLYKEKIIDIPQEVKILFSVETPEMAKREIDNKGLSVPFVLTLQPKLWKIYSYPTLALGKLIGGLVSGFEIKMQGEFKEIFEAMIQEIDDLHSENIIERNGTMILRKMNLKTDALENPWEYQTFKIQA